MQERAVGRARRRSVCVSDAASACAESLESRLLLSAQAVTSVADSGPGSLQDAIGGSISGIVYLDANGNGVQDAREPGIPGVTVFLDANRNGVLDLGEQTATTDGSGRYAFSGLLPGTYVVGEVPPTGYALTAPGTVAWRELGPDGINSIPYPGYLSNGRLAGRIMGIAPSPTDPNTLYVAAVGGGVWKTVNAGQSWTPLTDNQPSLVTSSIAVSRSDPNVIYAGTGDSSFAGDAMYGRGVLKSTDGGSTWTVVGQSHFDRMTVSKIVVDPANPDVVYAATMRSILNAVSSTYGVWKSTDGGTTWQNVTASSVGPQAGSVTDLLMDPANPQVLFAGFGEIFGAPSNGVWETTNGGATWARRTSLPSGTASGRLALSISSDGQSVYAAFSDPRPGDFGHLLALFRSGDGGSTWSLRLNTPDYMNGNGWACDMLATDPADPDRIYAASTGSYTTPYPTDAILRSDDGGASWTDIGFGTNGLGPHVDHHALAFDAMGRLWDGNDGGIYETADLGASWYDANANLGITLFNGIAVDPANPGLVFGGSQDGGTAFGFGSPVWAQIVGGDGGQVRYDPASNTLYHAYFYAKGSSGFFERSDNGGPFQVKTAGINVQTDSALFYLPYVMDPSNPNRLALGTDRVYVTTNRADLWVPISPVLGAAGSVVTALAIAPSDPQVIYVAYSDNSLWMTSDGGVSWTRRLSAAVASLPAASSAVPADAGDGGGSIALLVGQFGFDGTLAVDPQNPMIVYLARNSFPGGIVYQSTDGGALWSNITHNLPDLPAHAMAIDPRTSPPTLYVGLDAGVYQSRDGGGTWTRFGTGLPNAMVTDLELGAQASFLDVATYGRGAWQISLNPASALRQYAVTLTAVRPSSAGNDFGNQRVNLPPVVGSFAVTPDPAVAGASVVLSAGAVTDPDDTVTSVAFYLESNGTAGLQVSSDTYLGNGTPANGTWSLTAPTASLAPGVYTYYSLPTDSRGLSGAAVEASETLLAGGAVSGSVFDDLNHNGVRDPGESGFSGISVSAGGLTATTDADGNYLIAGLLPGAYAVAEQLPGGWARTTPLLSAASVTVADGQTASGPVFGDVQISTVPLDFGFLLTLAQHYGQAGTFADGDLNGDDQVNFADLLILAQNYGHAPPAGLAAGISADTGVESLKRRLQLRMRR